MVSSQFNLTFNTRNYRARYYRIITCVNELTNKMKSIRVVIRSTRNRDSLYRFTITRSSVKLRATILQEARAKRISTMFHLPVVFLRVTRIVDRRNSIYPPFFLRASRCSRTSKISTHLPRAIRAISAPFGFKLRTTKVMSIMVHFIVNFLGTGRAIRTIPFRRYVLFHFWKRRFCFRVTRMKFYRIRYTNCMKRTYFNQVFSHRRRRVLREYRLLSNLMFIRSFFFHRCNAQRKITSVRATVRTEINTKVHSMGERRRKSNFPRSYLNMFLTRSYRHLRVKNDNK